MLVCWLLPSVRRLLLPLLPVRREVPFSSLPRRGREEDESEFNPDTSREEAQKRSPTKTDPEQDTGLE